MERSSNGSKIEDDLSKGHAIKGSTERFMWYEGVQEIIRKVIRNTYSTLLLRKRRSLGIIEESPRVVYPKSLV